MSLKSKQRIEHLHVMKSIIIDGYEAQDIREQVEKILRGLGNPEPPLDLAIVRDLLDLDRKFYSSDDQSAVSEIVSRVKVAGKQIVKRPAILFDVIRKAKLSALWIPDKKRILIDKTKPKLKHRWSEAHEIGHSMIPWHQGLMLGDNEFSLNPRCHAQMEAEANYAAVQLLFLQDRFIAEALDVSTCLDSIKKLKGRFGNTYSSTLWRYVEEIGGNKPMVGLLSEHPHRPSVNFLPNKPCRHCIQSAGFQQQFSNISEIDLFGVITQYCGRQSGGPLGESEVVLNADDGAEHIFHFESFYNRYDVLTLGRQLHRRRVAVKV